MHVSMGQRAFILQNKGINAPSYSKCARLSTAPHSFPLSMHMQVYLCYQASSGEPLIIKLTLYGLFREKFKLDWRWGKRPRPQSWMNIIYKQLKLLATQSYPSREEEYLGASPLFQQMVLGSKVISQLVAGKRHQMLENCLLGRPKSSQQIKKADPSSWSGANLWILQCRPVKHIVKLITCNKYTNFFM